MLNNFLTKSKKNLPGPNRENKTRVFLISFISVLLAGFLLNSLMTRWCLSAYNNQTKDVNLAQNEVIENYKKILSKTNKSAQELLFEGISLTKNNQKQVAAIALEKAVELDSKWRDASLYTGYNYLRLTQEFSISNLPAGRQGSQFSINYQIKNTNDQKDDYLQKSKTYLEKARSIDPLNAQTHQLLVQVYNELGDTQNANLSQIKADDFSK